MTMGDLPVPTFISMVGAFGLMFGHTFAGFVLLVVGLASALVWQ